MDDLLLKKIGVIYNGYTEKFGIPRQSGMVDNLSKIVFEPEYSKKEAFRGIEGYEYLWIIWGFDKSARDGFVPTVRPPRLGGNKRVGVFATRSPFRPNPIAISSVKFEKIDFVGGKVELFVRGADILNGTPVYDVKPYIPFSDSHVSAKAGFSDNAKEYCLPVVFECDIQGEDKVLIKEITDILCRDPRPAYIEDDQRVYGVSYSGNDIIFKCVDGKIIVTEIKKD